MREGLHKLLRIINARYTGRSEVIQVFPKDVKTIPAYILCVIIGHSFRRELTGFAIVAFTAWKLTTSNARVNVSIPDLSRIHQVMVMRYVYCSSQFSITHHVSMPFLKIAVCYNDFLRCSEICYAYTCVQFKC
jgi:hypothetical protein